MVNLEELYESLSNIQELIKETSLGGILDGFGMAVCSIITDYKEMLEPLLFSEDE